MDYDVRFVAAEELPDEHDWMLVRQSGRKTLFLNRDRISPELIRDVWMGYDDVHSIN